MSTPTTRRAFLGHIAALAAAPLALRAAAASNPPAAGAPEPTPFTVVPATDADLRAMGYVKVPSNRVAMGKWTPEAGIYRQWHEYHGDWDGTFRWERGCTNPAYVLADLYHRTGAEPDWVSSLRGVMIVGQEATPTGFYLNWQTLYDWGRHCDEVVTASHDLPTSEWPHHWVLFGRGARGEIRSDRTGPRFTVKLEPGTDLESARRVLRMYCLKWQSTDPRYRTSWPGVPYPGGEVRA